MAAEGGALELATILPVAVMGPVMGMEISGSNHLIQRILDGAMPGYPDLWIPIVDVRDVAAAHLLAMTTPGAAGRRFLLSSGPAIPLKRIGAILKDHLGDAAKRVPTRSIPIFNREFRPIVPDLGYAKKVPSDRAQRVLGWKARNAEDAVLGTAESMLDKGLVTK